uniref:Uncharacterized protein n=1 Tax=Cannabis sativa TaxID=3483 RepID=A0A803P496_CANSA
MAKTKNAQPSKRPAQGSTYASPPSQPVPPVPVTGAPGSKVSTPKKLELVQPKGVSKGKKVVTSSSKGKSLKEHPPSVSSLNSKLEEVTKDVDQESEGESDSNEEFVPKEQPSADDSGSESEVLEGYPISAKQVTVPATVPKKDKGKRPMVTPRPILSQKRKMPYGNTLENFKPHSHYFCYNDNARDMKFYENKNFTEFYANIIDEFLDEDSFMFGKVFVRGHMYSFTMKDVAETLNLPMEIEPTDMEFYHQKVFGYLNSDNDVELSYTIPIVSTYLSSCCSYDACPIQFVSLLEFEELILENETIEILAVGTTFNVPEKPPQGKSTKKKARSASPGAVDEHAATSTSTYALTEMIEFNLHLGRMETSQALLLRRMNNIMKFFQSNDVE